MKFLKSQWPNIIFGSAALATAIIALVQGDELMAVAWTLSCVVWFIMAHINYNEERIKVLEREVEQIKNRAITDIEEKSANHFIVRRKLGPDKEKK